MKTRLLHTLLVLALLLPVGITAVAAQTENCPVETGKYDGTMNAALSYRDESEGSRSFVEMISRGELHFTISCDHVTGTVTRTTDFAANAEQDNDSTVFDSSGTCIIKGEVAASNIVKNGNAPAELQVRFDFTEVTGECVGGGPGGHPLQIVAYPQVGQPSDMVSGAVAIVQVPQWAKSLNFQAYPIDHHVIYRGTLNLPETSIKTPIITLPADVPYISGRWGLSPTQLKITVPANSLGGEYSDPGPEFSTTGQLYLGTNNTLDLRASGDITTTLTPTELTLGGSRFQLSLAQATLLDQQVAVSRFLPGADAIIAANIPVVSSLLESMNNVAYLKGNITDNLTGSGEISSNDTEIYLAQASLRSTVNVKAEADLGVDFFVKGHIGVGAKGALGVQLVPNPPKITECGMGLTVESRFVVLGQTLVDDESKPVTLPIPGCSDPVFTTEKPSGNFRLGATTPLSGGSTVGSLPEQTMISTSQVNNLPESTLVQNGSWLHLRWLLPPTARRRWAGRTWDKALLFRQAHHTPFGTRLKARFCVPFGMWLLVPPSLARPLPAA